MLTAAKQRWVDLAHGLYFIPGLLVFAHALLAILLDQLDQAINLRGSDLVFQGDASAARSVLATVAGSLITVAGLTFSLTVLTLQVTSSQFSPRVLRNFVGDRLVQATAGTFVGAFVYSLLVLRSVGEIGADSSYVPRMSVTVALVLGIVASILLLVFIHHITQLIQASHIIAGIGDEILSGIDDIYPERYGDPSEASGDDLLREWHADGAPGSVHPFRPGYVQLVSLDRLVDGLDGPCRIHIGLCPGDYASLDVEVARVWPAEATERATEVVRDAVGIASERDFAQDSHFGIRQLTDIAVKAMSPSVNDPTTAVTAIGSIRSALVRLAGRTFPSEVRRYPDRGITVVTRERGFDEYLEATTEIARYGAADARVVGALLRTLAAVARAANECRAEDRAHAALSAAETIVSQAVDEAKNPRDREAAERLGEEVRRTVAEAADTVSATRDH